MKNLDANDVVLVDGARTPVGTFMGALMDVGRTDSSRYVSGAPGPDGLGSRQYFIRWLA